MAFVAVIAAVGAVVSAIGLLGVWGGLFAVSVLVGVFALLADGDAVRDVLRRGGKT